MITLGGKNEVRNWLDGQSANRPAYLAIGYGTATPQEDDTSLANERSGRWAVTASTFNKTVSFIAEIDSLSTISNMREVGLYTALSGGTLYQRALFGTALSKGTTTEWKITVQIRAENG